MTAEIIQMADSRKLRVRRALDEWNDAGMNWAEKTLTLAIELKAARDDVGGDDRAFGHWLIDSGCDDLGQNERAALINIAQHIEISREILETTSRKSVRHIWLEEIKPLTFHRMVKDDPPALSSPPPPPPEPAPAPAVPNLPAIITPDSGCRVKVPEGTLLSDLARKGIALMEQGVAVEKIRKNNLGISLHTFRYVRDIVLLSQRNDLNAKDAETVRQVLQEVDKTRRVRKPWERVAPIAQRVWGNKGNRLKTDKRRAQQFEDAINFVLGTCESAIGIVIPHITDSQADVAVEKLSEAEQSLRKLKARIREALS